MVTSAFILYSFFRSCKSISLASHYDQCAPMNHLNIFGYSTRDFLYFVSMKCKELTWKNSDHRSLCMWWLQSSRRARLEVFFCIIWFCFRAPRRESELHYDMALYILLAGYLWAQNSTKKKIIFMLLEILKTISPVLCHSPYLITLQPVRERRRRCEKQSG